MVLSTEVIMSASKYLGNKELRDNFPTIAELIFRKGAADPSTWGMIQKGGGDEDGEIDFGKASPG